MLIGLYACRRCLRDCHSKLLVARVFGGGGGDVVSGDITSLRGFVGPRLVLILGYVIGNMVQIEGVGEEALEGRPQQTGVDTLLWLFSPTRGKEMKKK